MCHAENGGLQHIFMHVCHFHPLLRLSPFPQLPFSLLMVSRLHSRILKLSNAFYKWGKALLFETLMHENVFRLSLSSIPSPLIPSLTISWVLLFLNPPKSSSCQYVHRCKVMDRNIPRLHRAEIKSPPPLDWLVSGFSQTPPPTLQTVITISFGDLWEFDGETQLLKFTQWSILHSRKK